MNRKRFHIDLRDDHSVTIYIVTIEDDSHLYPDTQSIEISNIDDLVQLKKEIDYAIKLVKDSTRKNILNYLGINDNENQY